MNPHLRSGALAAALLVLSRCATSLFSTFNQPNLAFVSLAPLLPFIFTVGGGLHGPHRPEWLVYTAAFLAWWMVIDLSSRLFRARPRLNAVAAFAVPAALYVVVGAFVFVVPRFRPADVDPVPHWTDVQGGLPNRRKVAEPVRTR
jgi:hypothetical protein